MIVGHSYLVKSFQELIKRDRLSHGYIFFGEPEVGKFYFAKHLAHFLESKKFDISSRVLQDALTLGDPSTGSGQAATGIEAMRGLKNFLWLKPIISSKKTVIINNADQLTPEAQNAILKIAEEPPASALLILITNHLENLAPTLLSRFQKIYFSRLKDEEIKNMVKKDKIVAVSLGRPGRANKLLYNQTTKEAEKYASDFLGSSGARRTTLIKNLVEAQKEKPELLDEFFEFLILQLKKDPIKNLRVLKSALSRLFLIKNYNTNKRIQLEAI